MSETDRLGFKAPCARRTASAWVLASRLAVSTLHVVALGACAADAVSPPILPPVAPVVRPSDALPSAQTLAALQAGIGTATCHSDNQCHSVPVGARPCGGPEAYLAWSEQTAEATRISELAARHAKARSLDNARSGRATDCRFLPDPGAVCSPRSADGMKVCEPRAAADIGSR